MEYTDLATDATKRMCEDILHYIDDLILNALRSNGLPAYETFIKDNVICIRMEGDKFDHYWYHHGQQDQIRLISIEREPTFKYEMPDIINNNFKQTVELKYY